MKNVSTEAVLNKIMKLYMVTVEAHKKSECALESEYLSGKEVAYGEIYEYISSLVFSEEKPKSEAVLD